MLNINHAYRWISADQPPPVFEPENVESCRLWISEKNREKKAVLIAGGASHWFLGNNPGRVTDILSVRKLNQVIDYSPDDLTVSVEAGCPLSELNEILKRAGQFLPLLPVNPAHATLGGIVATGLEGPYGSVWGRPRDFLIGIEVLHPEGILSHAGGKVVKNVAGYDLCKLYTGSMGTLGVITKTIFKVSPRPVDSVTLVLSCDSLSELLKAALHLRDRVQPTALEWIRPGPDFMYKVLNSLNISTHQTETHPFLLAVRALDSAPLVKWKREQTCREYPRIQVLTDLQEEKFWSAWQGDFQSALQPDNQQVILRISTPLGLLSELYQSLCQKVRLEALTAHLGGGIIYLFVRGSDFLKGWEEFSTDWVSKQVYSMIFKADHELKDRISDVWGPTTQPLEMMKMIKRQLDPNGILNPNRFWGRI